MAFIIKSIVIMCAAILLLAAYSSENPLPRPPATDSTCHKWQLNTTSEIQSVTQVSNGITVLNVITPNQGLINELMMLTQYRLGLQTVCRMHYLYLRFEIALTKIDESDDNYISYSSAKYVAQHAMENACRWVQIVAAGDHDNNAAVRNCTLEDIDAACLDFQQYELSYFIRDMEIATYVKDPVRGLGTQIEGGSGSQEDWFNCTHSQSQQQLHPEAVNYILGKIRL